MTAWIALLKQYRPPTVASLAANRDPATNNFHLLRFIAASLVVLTHSYPLSGNGFVDPLLRWTGVMDFGLLAVAVFFILSGFLVTQSAVKSPGIWAFAFARILRIWPALILTALFATFIIGPWVTNLPVAEYFSSRQTYSYLVAVPLLGTGPELPGVFASNPFPGSVNGSLWTISIECWLYFLLGIALLAGITKSRWRFNTVSLLLLLIWFLEPTWIMNVMPKSSIWSTPKLVGGFLLGALIYRNGSCVPVSITLALVLSALSYVWWHWFGENVIPLFCCMAYWVIVLGLHPKLTFGWFPRRIDYSYGMYVFAFPVQQTIAALSMEAGKVTVGVTEMFFSSYVVTLLLAAVSWHAVESKALQLKQYGVSLLRRQWGFR